MARKKTGKSRIEPRFANAGSRTTLNVKLSTEDRVGAGLPGKSSGAGSKEKKQTTGRVAKAATGRAGNGITRKMPEKTSARTARWRLLRRFAYWTSVAGIWCTIILACLVGYHAAQLPQMSSWSIPQRPPNARIVSANGYLIANRGVTGGEAMRLGDMSPYIPKAVIAIEDQRFQQHFGIDPIGLARAMVENIIAGTIVQGGSTISQQLAKNLFLESDRTIGRKIQEAVLAIWLETRFSKDEILELYLNRVYFGSGAYGVDAAARRYFDKTAQDVTLAEAALLAGLLKAPSRLSPARDAKAADERAQIVLTAMRRAGFISDRETAQAMAMQAQKARHYWSGSEHYIADMVMGQLPALIGEMRHDIIVNTSLDFAMQQKAGDIIAQTLAKSENNHNVTQGALVAIDPMGAIRALVGGREYADSQFNRAVEARRQPGSAFKPIVYLAALEAGRTPESERQDAPIKVGNWTPENHENKYFGIVTLREALARSLNSIAAQLVMEIGPKTVTETARRLGIRSQLQRNASIALGTSELTLLELTSAYAPFANGGYSIMPWLIKSVRDKAGNLLYQRQEPDPKRVIRERELGMMNLMMQDVIRSGTGRAARLRGRQAAGKTGTTQNSRDALFIGYTANLVTGIWYGNDDDTAMKNVTGGTLPAQSWAQFMTAAHREIPVEELPGSHVPEFAVLPKFRPASPRTASPRYSGESYPGNENTGTTMRPTVEVGTVSQNRQRGILDLIFGQ
jgi:penicillin-binding protein 1A